MKKRKGTMKRIFVLMLTMLLLVQSGTVYGMQGQEELYTEDSESRQNEKKEEVQEYEVLSDGSLAGQPVRFVNLYWETDELGEIEAVFDGGTAETVVVSMNRKDRGVYETVIPEGDYSRIAFRISGSEEILPESCYNFYGMGVETETTKVTAYVQDLNDTFYYDMGENPSYWGSNPDYEGAGASTFAVNAGTGGPKPGEMVYVADLNAIENPEKTVSDRINIAFLKKGHSEPPVIGAGADGEAYTMYERQNGLYSAPFSEKVDEYSEIAFQLVNKDGQGGGWLSRHYNFRNESSGTQNETFGYFQYASGYKDTFYLNSDDLANVTNDASYWGTHPNRSNDSLDTQIFYIDTSDFTHNGLVADADNMWISWPGMEENLAGGEYVAGKGYKIKNVVAKANTRYFQFPYNSGVTENSVLTLQYMLKRTDGGENEYKDKVFRYKFLLIPNSSSNCLQLDYVWEFNGQMWVPFDVGNIESKTIFFHNIKTKYDEIQMRMSQSSSGSYVTKEELKTGFNWTDEQINQYVVEENGSAWIRLDLLTDEQAAKYHKSNLYQMNISSTITHVQFRGKKGTSYYYSNWTEIRNNLSYPCYYPSQIGVSSETVPEVDVERPGITGFWRSVYSVDTTGDQSMDIPEAVFVREKNTYYGNSTFYDYYSTWEMKGEQKGAKDDKEYYHQGDSFNKATEGYYKAHGAEIIDNFAPLYAYSDGLTQFWKGDIPDNKYVGAKNGPRVGMADTSLTPKNMITIKGIEMPFFNKEFLRGDNAFHTAVGNVYENVLFPFNLDVDKESRTYGYWVFDSAREQDAVRLSYDADEGYFLKRTGKPIKFNNLYGFFPYNDLEDVSSSSEKNADMKKLNCLFGTQLNLDFQLTEDRVIYNSYRGKEEPIRFEFQGDDDTWVYIDGIQALDMGGIHDAVRGEINFKDGTYTIWKDLKFGNHYDGVGIVDKKGNLPAELVKKLNEKENHTLTIYYMERGLYESNLKVSFNFPRENTFTVEKEVDIASGEAKPEQENIFRELLQNMGGFGFELKNLVTSGNALPVEQGAGYMEPGEGKALYNAQTDATFGFAEVAGTVTKGIDAQGKPIIDVVQNAFISGAEPKEGDLLKITPVNGPMDITDMSSLRLVLTNKGVSDTDARNLYLSFIDHNGKRVGGYANTIGYEGETGSFLKGEKTILRIDYRKMKGASDFDWANVNCMLMGVRREKAERTAEYLISSIEFFKTQKIVPVSGFGVGNEQISDYGSYNNGTLTLVDRAWYVRQNKTGENTYDTGVSRMTEQGQFFLADGQRAVFQDKFRSGSYLAIQEKNVDPKVFDTQWSILENGKEVPGKYLLSTRDDVTSVQNPLDMITKEKEYPLKEQAGTKIEDGRVENVDPEWIKENGKFRQPGSEANPEETMVYRGYANPDATSSMSTDLGVYVKNTLKYGSLTIEKKLSDVMKHSDGTFTPGDYQFDVYYTDIAGLGLEYQLAPVENNYRYVRQTVTVHVDNTGTGRVTIPNIPAGTTYRIVERPSNGTRLVGIHVDDKEGEVSLHENVRVVGVEGEGTAADYTKAYVEGTAYASDKTITFENEKTPFYMDIEKIWRDGLTDKERAELGITEVHIKLQRRAYAHGQGEEVGWETVTKDYFDSPIGAAGEEYIVLKPDANASDKNWKTTSTKVLDFENSETKEPYEYRIQEIDQMGNLKNYEVSYDEVRNPDKAGADGKTYLHVTYQAINTPVSIRLEKIWKDNDDVAGVRPDKVRVKLLGSSRWNPNEPGAQADWKCYKALSDSTHVCNENCWFELTAGNAWKKATESLPKEDADNKPYYYRLGEEEIFTNGNWIPVAEDINGYEVNYGTPALPEGDGNVSITAENQLALGDIILDKKDQETNTALEGAEFKLERLIPKDGTADEKLETDKTFPERTAVSSATGMVKFQNLPYGKYKITEIKAPKGYMLLKEPVYITLDATTCDNMGKISITVHNTKGFDLPKTGGRGIFIFLIGGVALVLTTASTLLIRANKKKMKRRKRR